MRGIRRMAISFYVSSGIVSSGLIIPNSAKCFVLSGGTIQDTQIQAGGSVTLIAGSASSTFVSSGGLLAIQSGTAIDTEISMGGIIRISGGATVSNGTISNGASGTVAGNLENYTILSGGQITIAPGANISSLNIDEGGKVVLSLSNDVNVSGYSAGAIFFISNGILSNFTMASGCVLSTYSGTSANNIVIAEGANIFVYTGASINGLNIESGAFECTYELDINTTILNAQYSGREFFVSGGTVTGLFIPERGKLFLSSGITATDISFNGDNMKISAGAKIFSSYINGSVEEMDGFMSDIILGEDAYVEISAGSANHTSINGGKLYVYDRANANDIIINSGGSLRISSGGTATNIIENGGYLYWKEGAIVSITPNSINGLTLNTSATIHSGTIATDTTVNSKGRIDIYSGGTANNTTVNSGGFLFVSSGGIATDVIENGGCVSCGNGAQINFISNNFTGLTLNRSATVHSLTIAKNTTLNSGGNLHISAGGVASNTEINSKGNIYVSSGGLVETAIVNSRGTIHASNGGTANNVFVNSGGTMNVSSGGRAQKTSINSGGNMVLFSGGDASSTHVQSGGRMSISSGGRAQKTSINAGGNVHIFGGGTAEDIELIGGVLNIDSLSDIEDVTVSAPGATISNAGNDLSCIESLTIGGSAPLNLDTPYLTLTGTNAFDINDTDINIFGDFLITRDTITVIKSICGIENIYNKNIRVNGSNIAINSDDDSLYKVIYNNDLNTLNVSLNLHDLTNTHDLRGMFDSGNKIAIDFGTASTVINKENIDNRIGAEQSKVLTATNDMIMLGGGADKTEIQLTMFSNGHSIITKDINWNGYFFGGGNSALTSDNHVTIGAETQILYGFGGGCLLTSNAHYGTIDNPINTSLTIGANVNHESNLLCAGSYVSANTETFSDTALIIEADSGMTAGNDTNVAYVMGGSYVLNGAKYIVHGDSTINIASGNMRDLFGAGDINQANTSYTHDGNIILTMTGGTVSKYIFGGIFCSSELVNQNTKIITGDINLTFDCSKDSIELFTVYGGCNGYATLEGNISITFTGNGNNLTFAEGQSSIIGDNASNISGWESSSRHSSLIFDSYTGNFNAKIINKFNEIRFVNDSDVNFTQVKSLSNIKIWNFDANSSLNWTNLQNNNFANDDLNFGSLGENINSDYTFFSANDEIGINGFESLNRVTIFGIETGEFDDSINGYATDNYCIVLESDEETTWNLVVKQI